MKSLLSLSFLLFAVCTGTSNERPNPLSQSEEISAVLRGVILQEKIPGIIAAISSSEGILAIGSGGVRKIGTRDTITNHDLMHLGSCTKAMTALMLATLVDEGLIRWDTQLIQVLPELKGTIHPDYHSITIWQLLTHRSRVPANAEDWWKHRNLELTKRRLEILRENLEAAPTIKPGSYHYSNLGYMIAGCIAEKLTGHSWESLMQKRIFTPLGMKTAGFGPPGALGKNEQPWGHRRSGSDWQPVQLDNAQSLGPAGRVHCTLEDWAKFLSLQLPDRKGKLFDQKLLQKLATPTDQYAGGWIVVKRSWGRGIVLTHGGSNTMWQAVVWVAPKLNRTFMVATNSKDKNSHAICDKMIAELIKIDQTHKN